MVYFTFPDSSNIDRLIKQYKPIDLKGKVKFNEMTPVGSGGFASVYHGEWEGNPVSSFPAILTRLLLGTRSL